MTTLFYLVLELHEDRIIPNPVPSGLHYRMRMHTLRMSEFLETTLESLAVYNKMAVLAVSISLPWRISPRCLHPRLTFLEIDVNWGPGTTARSLYRELSRSDMSPAAFAFSNNNFRSLCDARPVDLAPPAGVGCYDEDNRQPSATALYKQLSDRISGAQQLYIEVHRHN